MKKRFTLGMILLVAIWLLVGLYNLLPDHQGWVVFGAMAGMGMSLGCRGESEEGGMEA